MIFNTWLFGIFFLMTAVLYWLVVPQRLKRPYLIVAGCIFYAASIPSYLVLIVALSAVTYAATVLLLRSPGGRTQRRFLIAAVGVTVMVAVLFYFKYAKLFGTTIDDVCHGCLPVPSLIVPLAISFFTFEFVHVIVDVYLGKIVDVSALDFFTFALFFPTMVAGPIKRFESFAPQLHRPSKIRAVQLYAGGVRILCGLAKKSIIADSMTPFTAPLTNPAPTNGWWDYAVAVLAYSAKIYFDFSGYSDIAIGVANIFGISIFENFERPYWSQNIAEFWRRWHISLSSWIRDYIFIPLGGSRRSAPVTLANLSIAMALAGLWHGAAWHFVAWGIWHGVGLGVHRLWSVSIVPKVAVLRANAAFVGGASIAATFGFVALGWVLFASDTFEHAFAVYLALIGIRHG